MTHISPPLPVPIEVFPTKSRTVADLPRRQISSIAVRLYILASLAWDYADTVLDIAITRKDPATKKLARAVRQLKASYDRSRSSSIRDSDIHLERELSEQFESWCDTHIKRLCYGLDADKHISALNPDSRMLVKAVYMTLAVLSAMRLYAAEADKWIRSHGVVGHSILSDHFNALASLIAQFAGDQYRAHLQPVRLTASIIFNEIKQIELLHNGRKF